MVVTCTCGCRISVALEDADWTVRCPACGADVAVVAETELSGCASSWVVRRAVIIVVFMVILAAIMFPHGWPRPSEAVRRADCQNDLKTLDLVMKRFASKSAGSHYPELDPRPGRFMFDPDEVWQTYLTDASIMLCRSHPNFRRLSKLPATEQIDDHVYIYLGYAVTNMEEARAFAEAYQRQLDDGGDFSDDLTVSPGTGNAGGDVIYRLHEDIEAQVGLCQDEIPVMIERFDVEGFGHHVPGGGNVLYMDGHVEFIRYPGQFPMIREFIELIESLEQKTVRRAW